MPSIRNSQFAIRNEFEPQENARNAKEKSLSFAILAFLCGNPIRNPQFAIRNGPTD